MNGLPYSAEDYGLPNPRTLFADSGGDITRCELCEEPLDETREWKRGLDGAGAHLDCLASFVR